MDSLVCLVIIIDSASGLMCLNRGWGSGLPEHRRRAGSKMNAVGEARGKLWPYAGSSKHLWRGSELLIEPLQLHVQGRLAAVQRDKCSDTCFIHLVSVSTWHRQDVLDVNEFRRWYTAERTVSRLEGYSPQEASISPLWNISYLCLCCWTGSNLTAERWHFM